ncbi:MAG: energy-coupling factor transporter transmembrane component T, partial [Candidatus Hodarchaeales archaeon]
MLIDPRVSLFTLLSFFILILLSPNLIFQIIIVGLFLLWYSNLTSIRQMAKIWVLITIPTFFILILNWVFVSQVIDHLLLMVLRFWGMTWLFNWFLKQVEPDDLAKALWALHIPYNFAWQISLAYRFIPMFQEETQNIYNMQISRGIPLDGKIIVKLKYLPSVSVPLIVMTQDKATLFSEALFARNWNIKSPKTVLDPLEMQAKDWLLLGIIFCIVITQFL